ncbi:MAG: oxidoreductase [Gemmatimonadetes bacterium]|nr:oxidoreductase [Gemmatimonadota bacterium]
MVRRHTAQVRGRMVAGSTVAPVLVSVLVGPGTRAAQGQDRVGPEVIEITSGVGAVLQAVSPVSDSVVWMSGHEGVIIRTLDAGDRWERVNAPSGDSLQFRDVHGFSAAHAVALSAGSGPASRIYRTADGGRSWELAFAMDHPDGFLDCLDFWDDGRGFAYGDSFDGVPYILVTADGGATWERAPRDGLPAANEGEGGFAASGTCARAVGDGLGWIGTGAGGSARVLRTSDYGATWTATDVDIARGPSAGVYTLAVDPAVASGTSGWVLALGGDYAADAVLANVAVSSDLGGSWRHGEDAPVPGAIYGSAIAHDETGLTAVAVSPAGAAFTTTLGMSWTSLPGVSAWAVEAAPTGTMFWAAGAEGRILLIAF